MTTLPETAIQQSTLIGRLILNRDTAEELGHVSQIWLDTIEHRVVLIACKSGLLGRNVQFFKWEQIEAIGEDSILLSSPTETIKIEPDSGDLFIGHELFTDDGNKAGTVSDYCFDPETGIVVAYLFISNGWQGMTDGTYVLMPQDIVSLGAKRLIAKAQQVKNAEQFSGGLRGKIAQATEFLKESYAQTRRDMADVVEGGQSIASQIQEKTHQVAEQTQTKLAAVAGQVQEKAATIQTKLETNPKEEVDEHEKPDTLSKQDATST